MLSHPSPLPGASSVYIENPTRIAIGAVALIVVIFLHVVASHGGGVMTIVRGQVGIR